MDRRYNHKWYELLPGKLEGWMERLVLIELLTMLLLAIVVLLLSIWNPELPASIGGIVFGLMALVLGVYLFRRSKDGWLTDHPTFWSVLPPSTVPFLITLGGSLSILVAIVKAA